MAGRNDSHRKFWIQILILLVVGGAFFGWLGWAFMARQRAVPPATVQSWDQYLAEMPTPRSFMLIQMFSGDEFVLAVGPKPTTPFVKGPPMYVFNQDGHLIDWTADSGNDPDFTKDWIDLTMQEDVERKYVDGWFR